MYETVLSAQNDRFFRVGGYNDVKATAGGLVAADCGLCGTAEMQMPCIFNAAEQVPETWFSPFIVHHDVEKRQPREGVTPVHANVRMGAVQCM